MFETASGVNVPFPEKIREEFQIFDTSILFNLSFEKFESILAKFLEQLLEPLFFVLEIPLSQREESELRKNDSYPFHKKVCYLDGQSKEQILVILNLYGDLLLNDGMSQFAVYSHATNDGIYIQKYKIASIYSQEPTKYRGFLESYGLTQTKNILTVWDTFSHESPGQVQRVEADGIDVFKVYDELVKIGMYDAKIVED